MKKTLESLFYSGLAIIFMPIVVAVLIFAVSANTSSNEKNSPQEIVERRIIYDTVKVRVEVPEVIVAKPKKEKKKPKEEKDSVQQDLDTL